MEIGRECPKTQKSILKAADRTQYAIINMDDVAPENDFGVYPDIKVENELQSKLVFGRSGE